MLKAALITLTDKEELEEPKINTSSSAVEDIDLPVILQQLYKEKPVKQALKQFILGDTVTMFRQYKIDQALVTAREGRLYITNRFRGHSLLILPTDSELMYKIRTYLIKECYSILSAGYLGVAKTFGLLIRAYVQPFVQQTVKRFIRNYKVCRTTKPTY